MGLYTRVLLVSSALLVLSSAKTVLTDQDQSIRSQVRMVAVDVRVFDSDARIIADLAADEFDVFEDGVRQAVSLLYRVSGPGSGRGVRVLERLKGAWTAPGPDVSAPRTRQTWIFFFDENHLTPGAGFERARQAVAEFITEGFPLGDLAGVIAGSAVVDNRITSSREEMLAAVMKVKPPTAARTRQLDQIEVQRRLWRDEAERSFRELEARRMRAEAERDRDQTLNTIRALVRQLAGIDGPKTVVFLSDGFAFGASPEAFAAGTDSYSTPTFDAAVRADVRFYTVDVRGLNHDRGAADVDRIPIDINDATALKLPRIGIFEADAGDSVAQATGGFNVRGQNNLRLVLDRIALDAGNYYVLGYQPTRPEMDGSFRRIEVKVRREGVHIRARRGYFASLSHADRS